jgi:hypothetical protein
MNQQQVKFELLSSSEKYFNSIEPLFSYRIKNIWKYNTINFFNALVTLLFITTIFPITPVLFKDILANKWKKSFSISTYVISLENFFVFWILSALVVSIIFLIFLGIKKISKNKNKKYSLAKDLLQFAYVAKVIKELDLFLINEREDNIDSALKYLKLYIKSSDAYYLIDTDDAAAASYIFLPKIFKNLKKHIFWLDFNNSTEQVLKAFEDFDSKVLRRIEYKEDILQVVDWLKNLSIYEYSKIKKNTTDISSEVNGNIRALGQEFFMLFCDCINISQIIEKKPVEQKSNFSLFNTISHFLENLCSLFTHRIAIVTFFSWLILLFILFSISTYIGIKIFSIKFDSTILITCLSGIIIGAITITATVYSKKA